MKLKSVDRSKHLRFKLGICLYQKTGYLTSFVRDVENRYMEDNLNSFLKTYNRSKKLKKSFTFRDYVGLRKGIWQVENGLCRTLKIPKSKIGKIIFKVKRFLKDALRDLLDKYKI